MFFMRTCHDMLGNAETIVNDYEDCTNDSGKKKGEEQEEVAKEENINQGRNLRDGN